jgi:hypothetical protein
MVYVVAVPSSEVEGAAESVSTRTALVSSSVLLQLIS